MFEVEELKKKALNVVEKDMKYYQEAVEGVEIWAKKECQCAYVLSRFCTRCSNLHSHKTEIQRIQDKYWHG